MLAVLSLLPISDTLCGLLCASAAAQPQNSGHHHAALTEPSQMTPSNGTRIVTFAEHSCDPGTTIQSVATAAERADLVVSAQGVTVVAVRDIAVPSTQPRSSSHGAPPGSTPPTSTPLVLRV